MVSVAEVKEFPPSELYAIIHDNGVGDPKSVDDVCEEKHGLFGLDFGNGMDFDPLRKFVDGD